MRLAEIEHRVGSLSELSRIVSAMRSIASMRVQEAALTLPSVREYGAQLAEALHDALAIVADRSHGVGGEDFSSVARSAPQQSTNPYDEGRALVIFMSEHGFVGGFNERLMTAAGSDLNRSVRLFILGARGAALVEERGYEATWSQSMALRLGGISHTVRCLQERLYPLIASGGITHVEVIFGRYQRGVAPEIERAPLFPLALPAIRTRDRRAVSPLHNLPGAQLIERLTAEYLLAQLTEAATESLAAENGARFAAMESGHDHISRRLGALHLEASRARQEEITTELLDLVIGVEAQGAFGEPESHAPT